jgi:hypothetical protein
LSIWSSDDLQGANGKLQCSSGNALIGQITPKLIEEGHIPTELILDGARAISAFCRPYPIRTVGRPTRLDFDISTATFKLWVSVSADNQASESIMTEIYLPFAHFAESISLAGAEISKSKLAKATLESSIHDLKKLDISSKETIASSSLELALDVTASKGKWETQGQTLRWYYPTPKTGEATYTIEIRRKGGVIPERLAKPMSWMDMIPQPTGCVIA